VGVARAREVGKNPKIADLIANTKTSRQRVEECSKRLVASATARDSCRREEQSGEIFAALYELNDPELIAALTALGKKCHLVLANGAFKPPDNDEKQEDTRAVAQRR